MMNISATVMNYMVVVPAKMIIFGNLLHVILSVTRHVKLTNILVLKIVHAKNF